MRIKLPKQSRIVASPVPFEGLRPSPDQRVEDKPRGLWYASGSEWLTWISENMIEERKKIRYIYALEISDRVLRLSNPAEIQKFTEQYGKAPDWAEKLLPSSSHIDWKAVSEKWAGIEISPYQWSLRLELFWYYGWDVASGCIWSPEGLVSWKLLLGEEHP